MKINIGATYSSAKGEIKINLTIAELIKKLQLKKKKRDVMYTMTLGGWSNVEFRAWTGPFRNFFSKHVNRDGAPGNIVLFEITGQPEEILKAVKPLIKGKVEWQTVNKENRKVRLWLSEDLGT